MALYVIKNGSIEIWDESKLTENKYFFRLHSNVEGVDIIDYDKTDIVPLVKDILNRQNQFIEIKYLKIILIMIFLVFCWVITSVIMVAKIPPPNFLVEKNEILTELKKITKFTENSFPTPSESRKSIDLIQEKNALDLIPK